MDIFGQTIILPPTKEHLADSVGLLTHLGDIICKMLLCLGFKAGKTYSFSDENTACLLAALFSCPHEIKCVFTIIKGIHILCLCLLTLLIITILVTTMQPIKLGKQFLKIDDIQCW